MKRNQWFAKMMFDEKEYNKMLAHMQELESYRNKIKGKPTSQELIKLLCNEDQINFYKWYLFHSDMVSNCDCRKCALIKAGEYGDEKHSFEFKLNKILTRIDNGEFAWEDKLENKNAV